MSQLKRTPFYHRHVASGARMVEFAGWEMPVEYPTGIVKEHLATRKGAGLFDVSHMGRFIFRGRGALGFLQHSLTNNAAALDIRTTGAQYTLIPSRTGGAVDDAYLYSFKENEYLLVVNAANRDKDWEHLQALLSGITHVESLDRTEDIAMLSLQGPRSRQILEGLIQTGELPEPQRNSVSTMSISGAHVMVARTGYTGEPLCFELFVDRDKAPMLWDRIVEEGASPVGLGARDTLRLEAGLPLYGHEIGMDPEGREIPILACQVAKPAVSFSPLKGEFQGREPLLRQFKALERIMFRDYSLMADLPRMIRPMAVTGRGVARPGSKVFWQGRHVGYVTSGTMVPMWAVEGEGLEWTQTGQQKLRSICLAYIDSDIVDDERVQVEIRARMVEAVVVPYHLRSDAPPYARPIVSHREPLPSEQTPGYVEDRVLDLLKETVENTVWRQRECINLIPSEMALSPMARLLSVMDPAFRYAEHKEAKAFHDTAIFYYQGTDFIARVEDLLKDEMVRYLGCRHVEARLISGQMANMALFSAMVDYLNRADRRREARRIRSVMCNHIGKGGHLSSQPMGALRDFIAHDPRTERPAVVNFPVLPENPFRIDVPATLDLIDEFRPELVIFGKSMVLHREPVSEIRNFLEDRGIDAVIMYDMAHVLGLIGPHFQEPFEEGADLVTGSTHKTYFGTQRGVVGCRYREDEERYQLWEALVRRTFPGSVSNHHLGTLLGLLVAAYEMNRFKDQYQPRVIANAKAFARALSDCGMDVAGDPRLDYTETHQVVVRVGYGRGPAVARLLEKNNIICNYQAVPSEEGFTAAGGLRLGVSEMTRFGMEEEDFRELAFLIQDVVEKGMEVRSRVKAFREQFLELRFCFRGDQYSDLLQTLHRLL